MGDLESELFESLKACRALKDGWEREACYGAVLMENVKAMDNPSHLSKYLQQFATLLTHAVLLFGMRRSTASIVFTGESSR
jgi:hypothetical protein